MVKDLTPYEKVLWIWDDQPSVIIAQKTLLIFDDIF